MKYWLLTTEYPPQHGGGISTYCFFTAQMLAEAGHAVTIFVNDDSQADYKISNEAGLQRVIHFNINCYGLAQSLGYTARLSYAFAGIVKEIIESEGKPDFIESQDYLGIAYYLTQYKHTGYSFLSGVPIILTIHSPAFIYLLYNRVPVYRFPDYWTGEMEKQSIAAADALIAPTYFILEELKKHICLPAVPTEVIANPYKIQRQPTPSYKKGKLIYYGKLSPQKGSFELLAYFKELWDDGFPLPLHIIGGTDIVFYPEMKTMGQMVKERYGAYIDRGLLQLQGKIEPSQIDQYLQEAHVVIVPSIVDNLPYVVMESMSRGKVVLASTAGGQREMMQEGISGFLFTHDQIGSFSEQLNKILLLPEEQVYEISRNAHDSVARQYSFNTIHHQKAAFLQQVKQTSVNHFPFLYQEKILQQSEKAFVPGLLSIVIPYYNMGGYLDECIQSINASTYKNIELLVINDGSTDRASIEKLNQKAAQKNMSIITRANHGLAETRNHGAAVARGEFLAFLDADDKIHAEYFEKAIRALKKNDNVFFAGAWVQYFGNSQRIWPTFTPQPPYALLHNPVNSSGLIYKRNAFLTAGLNDKAVGYGLEDYESVIHLLRMGFNGIVLPEILFFYRVRNGSMFRGITREKLLFSNRYISEKHKDFYTNYALPLINLLNANGPGYLYDNPTFATNISVNGKRPNILYEKLKSFIKKNEPLKRLALQLLKNKNTR
ncbi:MAG: glycosyltransferase [Chitinophagaceae bacterium]